MSDQQRYEIAPFEASDGWRWRMVAENGRIVATGAEAYSTKQHVERAIRSVRDAQLLAFID